MAKYELIESTVDILAITSSSSTYTLEDGSTKPVQGMPPVYVPGDHYILQTDTVISQADLSAKYRPL